MKPHVNRREFLAASAAGLGLLAAGRLGAAPFKTTLHKALIGGYPSEASLAKLKEAGFEGIECGAANTAPADAEKARAIAEKLGMRIHSVLRGWMNFDNPKRVAGDIKSVETALRAAQGYGADAILLVPCRSHVGPRPQPWEFDYELDPKTCHISRVVRGDNARFQKYIDEQNRATDLSREALQKLIPTAEKTGVVIGVENVWNNFWVKPAFFAAFVNSFQSKWVQTYFDIGNHVKYAPPEQWIQALGKTIVKCHVKDFKLNPDGHGGRFTNIRDGSINWPAVRAALDKVDYNGWMTIEGSGRLSIQERSTRLDLIIAGK